MHSCDGLAPFLMGEMEGKVWHSCTSTAVKLGLLPEVKGCPHNPWSFGEAKAMNVTDVQGSESDGHAT